MNLETLILLICFCIITCAALVVSSIALYKGIHITPRDVEPINNRASTSFVPIIQSDSAVISVANTATPVVSITYSPIFATSPFLVVRPTDNLSGQPCAPYLIEQSKTNFVAGVLSCPPNGYFVNTASNQQPEMVEFLVDNVKLPAILFVQGTNLMYQLAQDVNGLAWNSPKLLSSSFPSDGGKRLLNVDNNPVVAWIGSSVQFNFIKGDGPTWSTDLISLVTINIPDTNPISVSVFDLGLMPTTGFPVAIVQETGVTNNILQGVVCGDAGTNTGWSAAFTITQAGTNNIASMVNPLVANAVEFAVINNNPVIVYTTAAGRLVYDRNTSSTFPWTNASTTITASNARPINLQISTLALSSVITPLILCTDDVSQFVLTANDTNGTSWTYANRVRVNITNGYAAFYGNMISTGTQLALSFIDTIRNYKYVVVSSADLSSLGNNANMQSLDPTVGHTNYADMTLINDGIAFSYVIEGQLYYFRPPTGTITVDTNHTLQYSAIGV